MGKKAILEALDAEIQQLKQAIEILSAPDFRARVPGSAERSTGGRRSADVKARISGAQKKRSAARKKSNGK